MSKIPNINVGLFGHVDSGKTSIAKALSTHASTACFDKHPQSRERGITIDLGFSTFLIPAHESVRDQFEQARITLVDCPGHASLIRTVIGGVSIIDGIVLVVDITKGFQLQTSECLVLAEIVRKPLIVALNKTDKVPARMKDKYVARATEMTRRILAPTQFKDAPIITCSTKISDGNSSQIDDLVARISELVAIAVAAPAAPAAPFLFAYDHSFQVRGHGSVFTGTVLSGAVSVGDTVVVGASHTAAPVKSIQVFHEAVTTAGTGDRAGLCFGKKPPGAGPERGYIAAKDSLRLETMLLLECTPVRFYARPIETTFTLYIGHTSVSVRLLPLLDAPDGTVHRGAELAGLPHVEPPYEVGRRFVAAARVLDGTALLYRPGNSFVALNPALTSECRIAFYGTLAPLGDLLSTLRIVDWKEVAGKVDRVTGNTAILRDIVKKHEDAADFVGRNVTFAGGASGKIISTFGQTGKLKVEILNKSVTSGEVVTLRIKREVKRKLLTRFSEGA
eukprot:gnl/Chilomastix_cuspidata/2504.p1 GENE.gnl/Chilomastix_cuspidata/2504~~gnl/Chilomastix_cuspidata/2504.p1  ORF type:complete len:506 (-),score=157.80 gnl/Chilomastix_cuspidata/2504:77-1594(-)